MSQPLNPPRRAFLLSSGALAASALLPRMLFAHTGGAARLVVIILRGALDGLAAAPPYGDPDYRALRTRLALAGPGEPGGVLPLDGLFGLHPSLGFLGERYAAGELLLVQAVASPYRDRSHFDGQNVLENGLAQPLGSADGWLNRALAALPGNRADRAVAVSQNVPLILRGKAAVLAKSPQTTPDVDEELLLRLADLYSRDDWFAARLSEALQTEKMADGAAAITVSGEKVNPAARMAAALLRSADGPQVAVLEAGGWDTHADQGAAGGTLAQRLQGLDAALRTLSEDLGPVVQHTAVLIATEFGRTAAMNGTRGTDHGTGGCAFLVGGAVRGGRIVADWPGLARTALLDGRDLRPTLDLRSLFKGVLTEHLRLDGKVIERRVFPESSGARPLQGLIRA